MIKKISRILINTVILLLFLELLLATIYNYKEKLGYKEYINLKIEANVHPDMSKEAIEKMYFEYNELELKWTAYTHFSLKSFNGTYNKINAKGNRKTINKVSDSTAIKVFCFGGSTMYGIGSSNEQTIPSLLSKKLIEKYPNKTFNVTNFGVPGYNRNQENLQLQKEINIGNIPDIVLFYDGVNEVLTSFGNNEVALPMGSSKRNLEFNTAKSYSKKLSLFFKTSYTNRFVNYLSKKVFSRKLNTSKNTTSLAKNISNNYKQQVFFLENLSLKHHFKIKNYIQPTIFSKKQLTNYELVMKENDQELESLYAKTYKELLIKNSNVEKNSYTDLSKLFDTYNGIVFTDFCHTSEVGNNIIADVFLKDISEFLKN